MRPARVLRVARVLLLAGVACLSTSVPAAASIMTFSTPTGSVDPQHSNPVKATVTFNTSASGILVTLTNLLNDPLAVNQALSGLTFELASVPTTGTLTSSSALIRDIDDKQGVYTDLGVQDTGWKLDTSHATTTGFQLCVLCTSLGALGPSHLLIGGPRASTNKYSSANGSIKTAAPHNPFDAVTATFSIQVAGLTARDTILPSSVVFSFGTTGGDDVTGILVGGTVGEPGTMILLAAAALAGALQCARRTRGHVRAGAIAWPASTFTR